MVYLLLFFFINQLVLLYLSLFALISSDLLDISNRLSLEAIPLLINLKTSFFDDFEQFLMLFEIKAYMLNEKMLL